MKNTIKLSIITPEKEFYSGEVTEIVARNAEGSFGILPNHVGMITPLVPCVTKFKDKSGKTLTAFTSTGVLEIKDNKLSILCDAAEWPDEIDLKRAEEALSRSKMRLQKKGDKNIEARRAELAFARAAMRIRTKKNKTL